MRFVHGDMSLDSIGLAILVITVVITTVGLQITLGIIS